MKMASQRNATPALTTVLVEQLADQKGINPNTPEFCLYEDTDPEALERLFEETDGPLTTNLQIDDTCVTVEKTTDGEIAVEVDPTTPSQHASD